MEPARQGEREFTNRPESTERNKREKGERKARRERKTERAGRIEGEHWPGALLRAAPPFSPFLQETQRAGKKRRGDEEEQKPTFHPHLWER